MPHKLLGKRERRISDDGLGVGPVTSDLEKVSSDVHFSDWLDLSDVVGQPRERLGSDGAYDVASSDRWLNQDA
jgi:hypothetical protein